MVTEKDFISALGNPSTEAEAQIAVGKWLAEQIDHEPASITYCCLGHINGISYCAYADGNTLLGATITNIEEGQSLIAPSVKGKSNNERINDLVNGMLAMCKDEQYEAAAMIRNLITLLGVDPLTYEPK